MPYRIVRREPDRVIVQILPIGDSRGAAREVAFDLELDDEDVKPGPIAGGAAKTTVVPDPGRSGAPERFAQAVALRNSEGETEHLGTFNESITITNGATDAQFRQTVRAFAERQPEFRNAARGRRISVKVVSRSPGATTGDVRFSAEVFAMTPKEN